MNPHKPYTLAHVTHEAVDKIGGIGTVLEGLITSPVYQKHVGRTILVGPCGMHNLGDPEKHLGADGTLLYSSVDKIDRANLGPKLHAIEWAFNTPIVYGRRRFNLPGEGRQGEAEILLIDVFNISAKRLELFKHRLADRFGLESWRYEGAWDYEEYVRLAEPAFYALSALLNEADLPCVMFSHEFMGLPAAFKAVLDGQSQFRTIFHAHECSSARQVVENSPGHDTMFYNAMAEARRQGLYIRDVFGDLSAYFRHALISRSHLCDALVAVGEYTSREMHFLDRHFDHHHIDLVYNGLPDMKVTGKEKEASRKMLLDYSEKLLGWRPDVLMTHLARPVVSKGVWRDLRVCHELDRLLGEKERRGVLYLLTSAGGTRRPQDIAEMEREYGWPRKHRIGYPDLVGPEEGFNEIFEQFNAAHQNIQVILVNQFGWSVDRIGRRVPTGMELWHLRWATDVEFGMATYEPFGISPLEPLGCGAICLYTNICGCADFVRQAADGKKYPNVLEADFTVLEGGYGAGDLAKLKAIGQNERDRIEERVSAELAAELMKRLPTTEKERAALVKSGQELVARMGWDQVLQKSLIPVLDRVANNRK